jgi:hypothetical protein
MHQQQYVTASRKEDLNEVSDVKATTMESSTQKTRSDKEQLSFANNISHKQQPE